MVIYPMISQVMSMAKGRTTTHHDTTQRPLHVLIMGYDANRDG